MVSERSTAVVFGLTGLYIVVIFCGLRSITILASHVYYTSIICGQDLYAESFVVSERSTAVICNSVPSVISVPLW